MPSRQDSLGVGLQLQPTGFHWLPPQASAFEGFCFLLFEGFSFLLLEGFSSHAGAENGMPLEGFSFGRLASTEVLRQVVHEGAKARLGTRQPSPTCAGCLPDPSRRFASAQPPPRAPLEVDVAAVGE